MRILLFSFMSRHCFYETEGWLPLSKRRKWDKGERTLAMPLQTKRGSEKKISETQNECGQTAPCSVSGMRVRSPADVHI